MVKLYCEVDMTIMLRVIVVNMTAVEVMSADPWEAIQHELAKADCSYANDLKSAVVQIKMFGSYMHG